MTVEILEQEIRDNMPQQVTQVGLCGRKRCRRLCARSLHCLLGQARVSQLLGQYRQRRQLRWLVVGRAIGANSLKAAGSFGAFQLQLIWERQQKGKEVFKK